MNHLHLSSVDVDLTNEIRNTIVTDLVIDPEHDWYILRSTPQYSFILPDFTPFSNEFQELIRKDLFQTSHLIALTTCKPAILNWNNEFSHLTPLQTSGDGNCLLHAVSIGMWGVHDRELILRNALHQTLNGAASDKFKERWIFETKTKNNALEYSEETINILWKELQESSSSVPVVNDFGKVNFQYLEQLHIFVLAHIIRRPIIVYSEQRMDISNYQLGSSSVLIADDERMDGIYLPLLWPTEVCRKDPLALSFHSSHFASVVSSVQNQNVEDTEIRGEVVSKFPLVYENFSPINIRFLTEEEKNIPKDDFLLRWMNIEYTPSKILVAKQVASDPSNFISRLLSKYIQNAQNRADEEVKLNALRPKAIEVQQCRGGCGFTGTSETNGYCSVCYKRQIGVNSGNDLIEPASSLCKSGCGYMGTRENFGYCSVCYNKSRNKPQVLEETRSPCKAGCGFMGTQSQQGYCSVCYKSFLLSATIVQSMYQ